MVAGRGGAVAAGDQHCTKEGLVPKRGRIRTAADVGDVDTVDSAGVDVGSAINVGGMNLHACPADETHMIYK